MNRLIAALGLTASMLFGTTFAQDTPADAYSDATRISLGTSVAIDGDGATADGTHVTITEVGTYVISGTTTDGQVEVRAPGAEVNLVLDGASITNPAGPAIAITDATEATITLAADSINTLADGGTSEIDAALYSAAPLTIDGEGALDVYGNNNEGIESAMHITIESGTIHVWSIEDGLNANNDGLSEINISGGYLYIQTEIGDGIDSNGTITITGGTVISLAAIADGNSGLDADGAITIDGGTIIATGGPMMGSPAPGAAQEAIIVNYDATQAAGTLIVVQDRNGAEVLTFAPTTDYQQLLYSSDSLANGVSYTVFSGGSADGEAVDGLYESPSTETGSMVDSVTTDSAQESLRGPGRGRPSRSRQ